MPVAAVVDLEVVRGDTHTLTFRGKDTAGLPVDLSGRSYLMQVRAFPNSGVVAAEYLVDMLDSATGQIVFRLTASTTGDMAAGPYRYDIQETGEDEVTVSTVVAGAWLLVADVSRAGV